jgi:hypothetical protein
MIRAATPPGDRRHTNCLARALATIPNPRSTIMRRIPIAFAVLAITCVPPQITADDATKRSAELQVLDRYIGDWDSAVTVKATGETSKNVESKRWSKQGEFLISEDENLTTKKESHFLVTYDPNAKVYRACYIDEGNAQVFLGTWDKNTQTMKWISPEGSFARHEGTQKFIDKDHIEWSMVVTGPDGKVFVELSAKQTRRSK